MISNINLKNTLLAFVIYMLPVASLNAATYHITDLYTGSTSGFGYSAFHKSTWWNPAGGNGAIHHILLGDAGPSTWNTDSGEFILYVDIFSQGYAGNNPYILLGPNPSLTKIGTAVGTSSNLFGNNFQGDGGNLGDISWVFDVNANSDPKGLFANSTEISFVDYELTGSGVRTANTYTPPSATDDLGYLALWGSDLGYSKTCQKSKKRHHRRRHSNWYSCGPNIGVDFVAELSPVPLPAAVWLFGSAMIGFLGFSRRKST